MGHPLNKSSQDSHLLLTMQLAKNCILDFNLSLQTMKKIIDICLYCKLVLQFSQLEVSVHSDPSWNLRFTENLQDGPQCVIIIRIVELQ